MFYYETKSMIYQSWQFIKGHKVDMNQMAICIESTTYLSIQIYFFMIIVVSVRPNGGLHWSHKRVFDKNVFFMIILV